MKKFNLLPLAIGGLLFFATACGGGDEVQKDVKAMADKACECEKLATAEDQEALKTCNEEYMTLSKGMMEKYKEQSEDKEFMERTNTLYDEYVKECDAK